MRLGGGGSRSQGHDIPKAREISPDPGDAGLLRQAAEEGRILVTIDTDSPALIHLTGTAHAGIIRLPDVPAPRADLRRVILLDHSSSSTMRSMNL
jgi:predicted nuclease of predicted toxin-antitoxin system